MYCVHRICDLICFFFVWYCFGCLFFFFFQAEDGIRDGRVTSSDVCSSDLVELVGLLASCKREGHEGDSLPLMIVHRTAARFSLRTYARLMKSYAHGVSTMR